MTAMGGIAAGLARLVLANGLWSGLDTFDLVAELTSELHIGSRGFPSGARVAVAVETSGAPYLETEALSGQLFLRLEALGAGSFVAVRPGPEAASRAVAAGAEWLLRVRVAAGVDQVRAEAELAEVDRGLWAPLPSPPPVWATSRVERVFEADRTTNRAPAVGERPTGPRRSAGLTLGPPLTLLRWPAPVWAMALCPTGHGERLALLEARRLVVVRLDGSRAQVEGSIDLSSRRRAPEPVRAPLGTLRCGPRGHLGVGHGHLVEGLEVRLEQPRLTRTLPGLPLGWSKGGWWLGHTDRGRRQLTNRLVKPSGETLETEGPLIELLALGPRMLAVDTSQALRPLTATGAFGLPLARTGVGLSARQDGDTVWVVSTSPALGDERIRVMRGTDWAEIALPRAAVATAIGHPRGPRWAVLVALEARPRAKPSEDNGAADQAPQRGLNTDQRMSTPLILIPVEDRR